MNVDDQNKNYKQTSASTCISKTWQPMRFEPMFAPTGDVFHACRRLTMLAKVSEKLSWFPAIVRIFVKHRNRPM